MAKLAREPQFEMEKKDSFHYYCMVVNYGDPIIELDCLDARIMFVQ